MTRTENFHALPQPFTTQPGKRRTYFPPFHSRPVDELSWDSPPTPPAVREWQLTVQAAARATPAAPQPTRDAGAAIAQSDEAGASRHKGAAMAAGATQSHDADMPDAQLVSTAGALADKGRTRNTEGMHEALKRLRMMGPAEDRRLGAVRFDLEDEAPDYPDKPAVDLSRFLSSSSGSGSEADMVPQDDVQDTAAMRLMEMPTSPSGGQQAGVPAMANHVQSAAKGAAGPAAGKGCQSFGSDTAQAADHEDANLPSVPRSMQDAPEPTSSLSEPDVGETATGKDGNLGCCHMDR